jgi:hypothetical protein
VAVLLAACVLMLGAWAEPIIPGLVTGTLEPELRGQVLAENKQVRKLIAAFSVRPGMPTATEEQIVSGEIEVELVPQGILVERCRAGGAGIPAFYAAASVGTDLAKGRAARSPTPPSTSRNPTTQLPVRANGKPTGSRSLPPRPHPPKERAVVWNR